MANSTENKEVSKIAVIQVFRQIAVLGTAEDGMPLGAITTHIEAGLRKNYKVFNHQYDGAFAKYCQEIGYDDDTAEDLKHHLNEENCIHILTIDFDDNFPIPDQRQSFIQSALRACNDGIIDQFITKHGPTFLPNSLVMRYLISFNRCVEDVFHI